eukprot:TRINITY_DN798_c0_g2_i1.p1 TRINITY_DN798_c0_g2~~TRINITY_DN798_c0_g2_i1.p1  ORF type:complete len:234 (-),score=22.97 TRINITY_DN798_c0_g2_i1:750-1451(-)
MQCGFRQLLGGCSRPLHMRNDVHEESQETKDMMGFSPSRYGCMSVIRLRTAVELHAIFRHLQVRWQLFSEALTRFRDVDSMTAMCTDNVVWSKYLSDHLISNKVSQLSQHLQTLIAQRLSLTVLVGRVTKVSPSGQVDLSLDQDGHFGKLPERQLKNAQAALETLSACKTREEIASWEVGDPSVVLEEDRYSLRNEEGVVLEEGSRLVLWEQHRATWYVRACISFNDFRIVGL